MYGTCVNTLKYAQPSLFCLIRPLSVIKADYQTRGLSPMRSVILSVTARDALMRALSLSSYFIFISKNPAVNVGVRACFRDFKLKTEAWKNNSLRQREKRSV